MRMIAAYPLTWPPGFPRHPKRETGAFKTALAGALKNVNTSLNAFARDSNLKIESLVISSNVTLGAMNPADPGVAVWFGWSGIQVCIPVDRYTKVESNLQAIHHIIEARRTELRHGTLALVRASFTGFQALPAPKETRHWAAVLGFPSGAVISTKDEVTKAYRLLRSEKHKAGSTEEFMDIEQAYSEACAFFGEKL